MLNDSIPLKHCNKCDRDLPASTVYFFKAGKSSHKLMATCKECRGSRFAETRLPLEPCADGYKRCTKCKEEKPATAEHFWNSGARLTAYCKECGKQSQLEWRQNNTEKHRENARKWQRANPEKRKDITRRWRDNHPGKHLEVVRKSRAANPERTKERGRANRRRRVSRERSVEHTFTIEDERASLNYFNGCCAVCERPLNDLFGTHVAAMDHWIPISKGGATVRQNMVPLCHGLNGCNTSKRDTDALEWLVYKFGAAKAKKILARIQAYFDSLEVQS